jgi:hypothetical protein
VAAHASLSPVFPINTREESKKKKNKEEGGRQNRRGKELKIERKKKRKTEEEKKRKTQRSRGKKRERSPLGATAISPPGFPARKPPLLPPQAIANDSEQAPPLQVIFSSSSVPILVFIFICMQNVSISRSAANEL